MNLVGSAPDENAGTRSALVVDDGPVERLTGKAMLEKLGFAVRTAASGEEALELLAAQPARLVLCDVSMPGMSGLELLQAARALASPPIMVMVTGHGDEAFAQSAMQAGASAYLTKPLRLDTLRQTVGAVLPEMAGFS
jgi:CheY-like chemotaxis protein